MKRTFLVAVTVLATGIAMSTAAAAAPGAQPADQVRDPAGLASASADRLVAANAPALRIGAHDQMIRQSVQSNQGLQYVAYERTHRGLPVVGGDAVVVTDSAGRVLDTVSAQTTTLDVATDAVIGAGAAKATSRAQLPHVTSASAPRLVVLAWGTPRLAWETVVTGATASAPSKLHVFVDALTGEVTASYDEVMASTGNSYYNGTVTIDTAATSMSDPTRSGIRCGGQNGSTYTGSDPWGNGSGTDLETACVDALYAVQQEWDMLGAWLGRNGINGSGGGYPARVGLNAVNAYWNGSYTNFGHSQDNQRQATPIDVVAHEFGHAIFQTTPGGSGGGNETGGLNEGTGDIFGALTEAYANNPNDPPDYLVGEEVDLVGSGPIRNMYNPDALGDPNCWSTSIPNTEVHAAAGPINHWFYLLAEGSSPGGGKPNSPICSNGPSSVTGIGVEKAGKIFMGALMRKTSSWTYARARSAALDAAVDLYGTASVECATTKAAWNSINVPVQSGEPTCTAPGGVSVSNPGSQTSTVGTAVSPVGHTASGGTAPYSWSATGLPAGLSISSSTGTISGTPTAAGSYSVTVTATDSSSPSKSGSASYSWTVNTAPVPGCDGTNGTDVSVPDNSTVESSIVISGCSGNASATASVEVHIVHTYVGDLVVSLVAPDGSSYTLHNRSGGSANDINQTYTVNLSSEAANGTWRLRVRDAASLDTGRIDTWTLNLGGGTPPGCSGTNGSNVSIPDNSTVTSTIAVSGCSGNASASSQVEVHIVHTYIGDLVVTLVAPDGSAYTLHNRSGGGTDDINQTYTVDLSSESRNGTWTLRVQDAATYDTGTIDTWTLTL